MVSWFLVPCLVELRSEFNELNPDRDKGADGSVGDAAHQSTTSDHNPEANGRVKALDIDSSGPWPTGVTFDDAVMLVVERCRSGREDRIEYVIWDRHIYSLSSGFAKRTYTGTADPHTGHAHFSARHDHHGESDTRGWNLMSLEADMTAAELTAWAKSDAGKAALAAAAGVGVHGQRIGKSDVTIGVAFERLLDDQAATSTVVDAAKAEILAAIAASQGTLSGSSTPDEVVAQVLVRLLGDRKDAVMALMG